MGSHPQRRWLSLDVRCVTRSPFRMFIFATFGQGLNQSETEVAQIGLMILICSALWLLLRWIVSSPVSQDPWNEEVAAELGRDDCHQICHRCLTPHDSSLNFCPHCGAMVGNYTCLIPPLYLYPVGDVFRAGVEGTYRPSSFLTIGYFFAAISYAYWMPFPVGLLLVFVYWKKLWDNVPRNRTVQSEGT